MTDTSVSHDERHSTPFSEKLMSGQHDHCRSFVGTEKEFNEALLNYIYFIQGRKNPKEEFKLDESPDMPIEYMGSNPACLQFLQTLVLLKQPKNVVEIGTFVGMSGIFLAEHLPQNGHLYSFEFYETFAAIARKNVEQNGMADKVTITCGDGKETLPNKLKEIGSVDMAFIDGDKGAYADYFNIIDPYVPSGGLLIFDDMIFHGDALNEEATTEKGQGVKDMAELASCADNYHRTLLPVANGMVLMVKK